MPTLLTANKMTLIDYAKRSKDGAILAIAEVMNKVNSILDDAQWTASNGETQHVTSKRTSLPAGSWRKINQGVALEKEMQMECQRGGIPATPCPGRASCRCSWQTGRPRGRAAGASRRTGSAAGSSARGRTADAGRA